MTFNTMLNYIIQVHAMPYHVNKLCTSQRTCFNFNLNNRSDGLFTCPALTGSPAVHALDSIIMCLLSVILVFYAAFWCINWVFIYKLVHDLFLSIYFIGVIVYDLTSSIY